MFPADRTQADAAEFTTSDANALLDDEFFNPAEDDYLDRCLFEIRASVSDFRNF
jgi:hypothetical protein